MRPGPVRLAATSMTMVNDERGVCGLQTFWRDARFGDPQWVQRAY